MSIPSSSSSSMAPRPPPPTNLLLRGAPVVQSEQARGCRLPTVSPRFIAIVFLMCNNAMYITGMFIYDSNDFYIARSFFIFSLLINCFALYGIWRRKAAPIMPCYAVYTLTLAIDIFLCIILLICIDTTNYELLAKFLHDKLELDYEWSRMITRVVGYCSMCNAIISIAYLVVLVLALNSVTKEYGREKKIQKQVFPSAPPAYGEV